MFGAVGSSAVFVCRQNSKAGGPKIVAALDNTAPRCSIEGMEETSNLTAVTTALAATRPGYGLVYGVSLRRNNSEVDYLNAIGMEEHWPGDWTPDEATQLLRESGYEVIGEWEDIDHTGGEDPTWKAVIAESPVESLGNVELAELEESADVERQCSRTHCYCN